MSKLKSYLNLKQVKHKEIPEFLEIIKNNLDALFQMDLLDIFSGMYIYSDIFCKPNPFPLKESVIIIVF